MHAELLALTGKQRPRFPCPNWPSGNRGHSLPLSDTKPDRVAGDVAGIARKEPVGSTAPDEGIAVGPLTATRVRHQRNTPQNLIATSVRPLDRQQKLLVVGYRGASIRGWVLP